MPKFNIVLFAAFLSIGIARAEDAKAPPKADNYPLSTCLVSGEKFGGDMGDPVLMDYKGRTVKFCCKDCIKRFNKNPEKYLKILDEAEAKAKAAK